MSDSKRGSEGRGERGPRGHRGPHGRDGSAGSGTTGPAGLTGPSGPSGPSSSSRSQAKFSGLMQTSGNTLLADAGTANLGSNTFPAYPVPSAHALQNLATNLGGFVVPAASTIVFEVLVNGAVVAGYSVTYTTGESGVKTITFGPEALSANDTFALRVTPAGTFGSAVPVTATIEVA